MNSRARHTAQGTAPRIAAAIVHANPSLLVDSHYRLIEASPAAQEYLHPMDDAAPDSVLDRIDPALRAGLGKSLAHVFRTGEAHLSETLTIPRAGQPRRIALHVQPVPGDAKSPEVLVTLLDCGMAEGQATFAATMPDEAGSPFRKLVNATSFAIYRMSPDWSELRMLKGKGFLKDSLRPITGWMDIYIDPEDQPPVRAAIARAVKTGKIFEMEHPVLLPDGSKGWVLSRAVPIRDQSGRVTEWFGVGTDATARRDETERVAQGRRIEAIGRLAGGIAHDFNNLLTVVAANLELVEMRTEDPQSRRLLERAGKAVELGTSFNRRLLSLVGKRKLSPRRVDLAVQILDMSRLLDRATSERIQVRAELPPDLWPVRVDAGEVDSALINLVLNARDAMPEGGNVVLGARNVRLNATAARAIPGSRPGEFVQITIVDDGTGMEPGTLERATEAFFSTKPDNMGTGLGLYSVKGFLTDAQGFLNIASTRGEGTTVSLYLPRDPDPVAELPAAPQEGTAAPARQPRAGETVLVVEDESDVREVLCERLEVLGYHTLAARDAAEAQTLLTANPGIRLVLSDVVMPGKLDGFGLARWIAAERPEVRVVLSSGYAPDAPPGAPATILHKPYSSEDLARALLEV